MQILHRFLLLNEYNDTQYENQCEFNASDCFKNVIKK